jgi:hypothetical protein
MHNAKKLQFTVQDFCGCKSPFSNIGHYFPTLDMHSFTNLYISSNANHLHKPKHGFRIAAISKQASSNGL